MMTTSSYYLHIDSSSLNNIKKNPSFPYFQLNKPYI